MQSWDRPDDILLIVTEGSSAGVMQSQPASAGVPRP